MSQFAALFLVEENYHVDACGAAAVRPMYTRRRRSKEGKLEHTIKTFLKGIWGAL